MNRDEIRKLLGGYATGTLTAAEQKLLFEAALDDQELFDELEREQALKEMLDQPGARSRLVAALEPATPTAKSWWSKPWPWAAAATVAMGVVIAVALWPKPHKVELYSAANNPAPVPVSSPTVADHGQAKLAASKEDLASKPQSAPVKPPAAATAAPPALRDRQEQPRADEARKAANESEKKSEVDAKDNAIREVAAAAPPAPVRAIVPPSAPAGAQIVPDPGPVQSQFRPTEQSPSVQQSQLAQTQGGISRLAAEPADQRNRAKTSAFGGSAGMKAKVAPRFAFSYRFDGNGHLDITPLSDGFLVVTLGDSTGASDPYTLGSQGRVLSGQPVRINLTQITTSVAVVFSELNISRDLDALAKQQRVETKESGLIEDPTPTPNSRLSVTLQVPKRN
ncbi:MAG TPA: hypothetical protein VGP79_01000 [Bryobacteraceae bacterium]|jgi:hypothetical protein|nr:hypothetical protein [Bryobacteraceae bacterium]